MLNHNYMINRNTEISENGITEILENIEPDTLETEISEISENETMRLQENIDPVYAHNVREVTNPEYLEGVVLMRPKLRWRLYRNATFEPNP